MHDAVNREVKAVRTSVGIVDASTLGKIDIQGPDAAWFLNMVVRIRSSKTAIDILDDLLDIERVAGRTRTATRNAPRTLDLDLILYGNEIISGSDLRVPHPGFREREFVLRPLAEIAPDMIDPVTWKTIRELLRQG